VNRKEIKSEEGKNSREKKSRKEPKRYFDEKMKNNEERRKLW